MSPEVCGARITYDGPGISSTTHECGCQTGHGGWHHDGVKRWPNIATLPKRPETAR